MTLKWLKRIATLASGAAITTPRNTSGPRSNGLCRACFHLPLGLADATGTVASSIGNGR